MKGYYAYKDEEELEEIILFPGVLYAISNEDGFDLFWGDVGFLRESLHECGQWREELSRKGYGIRDFIILDNNLEDKVKEFIDLCFRDNSEYLVLNLAIELVENVLEEVGVDYLDKEDYADNWWLRGERPYGEAG